MSSDTASQTIVIQSTRFGELTVPYSSIIELPSGLIGFPRQRKFVMIDHKPPFSWLQSVDEPALAFVVMDGMHFGIQYDLKLPYADEACDFRTDDEFAVLIIVTVRPDPTLTTANVKAPVFVNVRNRKGVQVIYDDPKYSTRFPLWNEEEEEAGKEVSSTTEEPSK